MKLKILQGVLILVALITGIASYGLGEKAERAFMNGQIHEQGGVTTVGTVATAIDSGLSGGAIGMALICSVCIVMLVWLEINQMKLDKK